MFKYWLKNRFLFSLISIIVFGIGEFFFFEKANQQAYSENSLISSVYENSQIDFDIPAPTKEQLNEIKELDFVDDAFGYYYTESNVKLENGKNVKTKLLFSDMMDSIGFTMYNDLRLISKTDAAVNPIYIDYAFSSANSIKLGDKISFSNIDFDVSRIYETNSYFGSALMAPLSGSQKDLIESNSKSYSGAFLKANDLSKADSYLRDYKPRGRLKDRSDFSSDEEYQTHFNSWNNANYYNEITSFEAKRDSLKTKNEANIYVGLLISALLTIAVFIVLSFRKRERLYFSKKENKAGVKSYYIISIAFDFLSFGIVFSCLPLIAKMTILNYIPETYAVSHVIAGLISAFVVVLIESLYSLIFVKKAIYAGKK